MDVKAAQQIFNAGEYLEQEGKLQQAIACYQQAINLNSDNFFYHYKLGNLLRQQDKLVEATESLHQAIALNSNDSWSYYALGEILAKQQEITAAIEYYQQAIKLNPNFSWSHYNLARILHQQNQLEVAKSHYQQAIKLDPNFFWSHYFLAEILTEFEEITTAIYHYQEVIRLNPKFYPACYQLARHLQTQGQLESAIKYYHLALEIDQTDFDVYYYLGEALLQLQRFTEAISSYEAAIELHPNNLQPYFYIGQTLINQGQIAIEKYRQTITNQSSIFQVNLELGLAQAWQQQKEFSEAIKCCQRAIEIEPSAEMPYRILQYIPMDSEDIEQIISFYQKISNSTSSSPLLWGNLGDLLSNQGRITAAIDCYRTSCYQNTIKANPQLAELDWQYPKQKAPDFIIIGATKCGTTSLFFYLNQHPQILAPHKKEINFFNHNFQMGLPWYLAHFPAIADTDELITGEASPLYFYDEQVIQRLKELFPETKLIVMLRNPVERTISEYYHSVNHGLENRSLMELIELEQELLATQPRNEVMQKFGYLLNSIYVNKIAKWMTNFANENILIIDSELFFEQTDLIMTKTWEFLGLPYIEQEKRIRYNTGSYSPVTPEIKQKLQEFFIPYNQELEKYLNRKFNW
ncbi:MAG: tetratricopeptide repeat protein [Waterburya sp.]